MLALADALADRELEQALIVNLPIWETFFPQEKRRALKLMLKEVNYSATDGRAMYPSDSYSESSRVGHGKLNLTLNHDGIKRLYSLLHPELKK